MAPIRHGHTTNGTSPTYRSWSAMKARCLNPSNKFFADYGGRGISICDRWLMFENYEPGNVRWATASQQARNTRKRHLLDSEVDAIRALSSADHSQRDLAALFDTSKGQIWNVLRNQGIWALGKAA